MSGPGRRFDPSELLGGPGPEPTSVELADALAAARALEAHASGDRVRPTAGFEDRVMAAIATEPAPRFVVGAAFTGRGGRGGRPAVFLAAVRDAWAIATSGGRPLAVRTQALGFVLFVAIAAGSLTGVAAVGVGSFLATPPSPSPSLPAPTIAPSLVTPSPSSSPSPSPTVDPSPSPSSSPVPTETVNPVPTHLATETPTTTGTPEATNTPEATETVRPTESSDPTETPGASDDHGGGGSPGPG